MATVAFDVGALRRRFPALASGTAFLDGPGGTQVPDSVVAAMTEYLQSSNANVGGPFETSRRTDELVERAHDVAARFLGCSSEEVGFGANMTTLNFALSRALGRTLEAGDEIVVTRLDHDANVAPWLELARDTAAEVRFADIRIENCILDEGDLVRHLSSGRVRVVAFPWASNAVGTITDARRIAHLAHKVGALAWVDGVHYAPHRPIDVAAADVDVLLCSPYKFFGPHLGLFYARRELLETLRPYKVRPAPDEPLGHRFETGTLPHEALAGFVAAVEYLEEIGWDAIAAHEHELGERFLAGLPAGYGLHGISSMASRTPTFALTHAARSPLELAERLGKRGIATWAGNYYAVEIMERLRLPGGALRIGFVHYNTREEVDRVLAALRELA